MLQTVRPLVGAAKYTATRRVRSAPERDERLRGGRLQGAAGERDGQPVEPTYGE